MAADLHIHILEPPATEEDLVSFFSNTLGSKHFKPKPMSEWDSELWDRVLSTPDIWVGEVSWLKAALFEDAGAFIPPTVQAVHDLIGEDLPVIDESLVVEVTAAFDRPNATGYGVSRRDEVVAFLRENAGKRVFTISH